MRKKGGKGSQRAKEARPGRKRASLKSLAICKSGDSDIEHVKKEEGEKEM